MSLPAPIGPDGRPFDRIELHGLTATGRHGVFPTERRDGQPFTVDLTVHVDTRRAAGSDDLADTADYGALAVLAADLVRGDPVDLIETLAHRISLACLTVAPLAVAIDVTVFKPHAPIPETFTDAAVTVRRYRDDLPEEPLA
jgi:dihydroneopterin aldolase